MKIYVIRHGESEGNLARKWTGWFDAPLTEQGRADAQKAAAFLQNVAIDKVFSSDLCRAVETAKIALPGREPETTPLLREYDVGTLTGQPISVLADGQKIHAGKWGYGEFGGETKEQMRERICQMLKKLEELDCENVALFSHGGWLRTLLDVVVGADLPRAGIWCRNCTVGIFDYTGKGWKLHSWINLT